MRLMRILRSRMNASVNGRNDGPALNRSLAGNCRNIPRMVVRFVEKLKERYVLWKNRKPRQAMKDAFRRHQANGLIGDIPLDKTWFVPNRSGRPDLHG